MTREQQWVKKETAHACMFVSRERKRVKVRVRKWVLRMAEETARPIVPPDTIEFYYFCVRSMPKKEERTKGRERGFNVRAV